MGRPFIELRARLLPHLEGLDDVLFLDVVEVSEIDTALEAFADLRDVVLLPPQTLDGEVVGHHGAAPDEARLGVPADQAAADDTAGDVADLAGAEDRADLGGAELHFLVLRLQHALQGRLDLLDRLVDDRVEADLDALAVGLGLGPAVGPDVEAEDDRVGGHRQVHVGLGDGADAAVHDAQVHLLADVQLEQRVLQGLDRARAVTLDDEVELLDLTGLDDLLPVLDRDALAGAGHGRVPLAGRAALGDLPGHAVLLDHQEGVAGAGDRGQAEHLHRTGRARLGDRLAVLVHHGAHPAVGVADDHGVADPQRAALHQDGGHGAAAAVEAG